MPVSFPAPPMSDASAVITGASGFIGRELAKRFPDAAALRLSGDDWRGCIDAAPLEGAIVYHLAARVHRLGDADEGAYRRDNVDKTAHLAREVARRGARGLVFLSSAKVLGDESARPLDIDAPYAPGDAYARSKRAAEEALVVAGAGGRMPITIVRVPLVYGRGAAGNLEALRRLCDGPWPLPFAAVRNRRSWIHVEDVAVLLARVGGAMAPGVAVLHAAHAEPLSTPLLVAGVRRALHRAERLVPFPVAALEALAGAMGRGATMRRLTRSLEIDASRTCSSLGWRAEVDAARAFADIAAPSHE
jgi:nucleoside-diphosphate-sugar epimerase